MRNKKTETKQSASALKLTQAEIDELRTTFRDELRDELREEFRNERQSSRQQEIARSLLGNSLGI